MDWAEVSPGRFQRPADSLERFFVAAGKLGSAFGQEHFGLSFGAQIQTTSPDLEDALRQTWLALRFEHPKLAAFVDEENNFVYQAATPATVNAWLEETFHVSNVSTAAELFPSLLAPTRLARLFFLPASSEIVVSTSHWRIDGIGSAQFLSVLLQRLAEPKDSGAIQWGKETAFLPPSLDHVLSLQQTLPEAADLAQNKYLVSVGSKMPSIRIPPSHSQAVLSGEHGREELVLSKSLTSAILARCKEAGTFGPTAAVQAAMIAATQALQSPDDSAHNYVSMGAFSLRNHLPESMRKSDLSTAIYHTGLPFAITPSGSFAADAKAAHEFYKTAMTGDAVQGLAAMHNKLAYQLGQPPIEGAPVAADPALSSLGLIDSYIKEQYGAGSRKFDISKYWVGAPINTPNVWMHLWTFRGHMTFSWLFNKGLYNSEQIKSWQTAIKAVLCKELDISDA